VYRLVRIGELVIQNPWWKHGEGFVQFDRHLQVIKENVFCRKEIELKKGNIYILRGPRQVGKTTYLKLCVNELIRNGVNPDNILYVSCDFFITRRELRNALTYFINRNLDEKDLFIFIDEITSLNDWNVELKYLVDLGIVKKAIIVATGSNASALRRKGELLPGRGLEGNEYHMKPFSFREFIQQTIEPISDTLKEGELESSLKSLKNVINQNSITIGNSINDVCKAVEQLVPFKQELDYLFNFYLRCGGYPFVVNNFLVEKQKTGRFGLDIRLPEVIMRDVIGDILK
jgi:predicted AAA+ superfamily ATPase